MNRSDYDKKLYHLLSDDRTYKQLKRDPTPALLFDTKLAPTMFQPFPNGVAHVLCPTTTKRFNLRKVEQGHVVKRSPKRPREPEAICGAKKRLRRL